MDRAAWFAYIQGHNPALTDEKFDEDINFSSSLVNHFWMHPEKAQLAFVDMEDSAGPDMIVLEHVVLGMQAQDYATASAAILATAWATANTQRAQDDANKMLEAVLPEPIPIDPPIQLSAVEVPPA